MQQGVGLGLVCTPTEDRFVVLPQVLFPRAGILVGEKVLGGVFRQLPSFPTPPPVHLEVGAGGAWEGPLWMDGPPARAAASVRAAHEEPGPRGPQERVDLQ